MQKDLSVIIVNYNVCHFLEQALVSVYQALGTNISAEVFVVDNNSVDGSVAMVKSRFAQVELIINTENVGFSTANNQAIRRSNGRYVLLLNPDTVVEEDTFSRCLEFMDCHPQAGALGVRMVDGSGRFLPESKRGLPSPSVAFFKIFGFSALFPHSKIFGRYHLGFLDSHQTHSVEVLSGAFMWMRKSVLDKTGLLDEDFFMYGEDIDLSYRIIKSGYQNYYFADTQIIHYKGESTKRGSINYIRIFYNAMAIFAQKHYGGSSLGLYLFFIRLAIFLRAMLSIMHRLMAKAMLPILDAGFILIGMYFLKQYWQTYHKLVPTPYPPDFMQVVVPAYIMVWLGISYFGGCYDWPFRLSRCVRSIAVATLFISAITNFVDDYRFSKALILLGGVWAIVAMILVRLIYRLIYLKKLSNQSVGGLRICIVGSSSEAKRIKDILLKSDLNISVIGRIAPTNNEAQADIEPILGLIRQLKEIVSVYKINEVIFCTKDMRIKDIIYQMSNFKGLNRPDYRLVADASNYITGSSSKNTQSDYYSYEVRLAIYTPISRRNKRVFDICTSAILLVLAPIMVFFQANPKQYIKNVCKVLIGKYSWVGISAAQQHNNGSILKPGILTVASGLNNDMTKPQSIEYMEFLYAKDYTVYNDYEIVFRNRKRLCS